MKKEKEIEIEKEEEIEVEIEIDRRREDSSVVEIEVVEMIDREDSRFLERDFISSSSSPPSFSFVSHQHINNYNISTFISLSSPSLPLHFSFYLPLSVPSIFFWLLPLFFFFLSLLTLLFWYMYQDILIIDYDKYKGEKKKIERYLQDEDR